MQIMILTASGLQADEAELRGLRDWLMQEKPRPGRMEILPRKPDPGTMGALSDTLQISLGAGGAITVLAGSLTT